MLIHSDTHPVGGTIRWRVQYGRWLENTAFITTATVVSSDTNYVVSGVQVLGRDVIFNVAGGLLNLPVTLTVTITDSLGNILPDTVALIGVAP
jgi:hypothetical protein